MAASNPNNLIDSASASNPRPSVTWLELEREQWPVLAETRETQSRTAMTSSWGRTHRADAQNNKKKLVPSRRRRCLRQRWKATVPFLERWILLLAAVARPFEIHQSEKRFFPSFLPNQHSLLPKRGNGRTLVPQQSTTQQSTTQDGVDRKVKTKKQK